MSEEYSKRMNSMLFDYATTYKTNYQSLPLTEPVFTTYKKKEASEKTTFLPLKDVHTISDWKDKGIPFDLLWKRKEIIRTSPMQVQERHEKTIDPDREEARKTRPRLVMTPAVSMDDVTDPRARAILCGDMYTSETSRGLRESVSPYFSVQAPLPGLPAPANPVALPKLNTPLVPSEWKMETISWDGKQLRGYCDSSKEFWLKQDHQCTACVECTAVDAHRKMQRQMKRRR